MTRLGGVGAEGTPGGRLIAPEAERESLSAMMRDTSSIAKIAQILRPEHFTCKANALVFKAMVQVGDATDVDTLAARLRADGVLDSVGGLDALVKILNTEPHAARLDEHVQHVLDAAERREADRRGDELKRAAATGTREQFRAAKQDAASIASIASFTGGATAGPDDPLHLEPWPRRLDEAHLHGIAGDFVRLVGPHTESDSAALYFQFLVAFGNLVGRGPYVQVEATRHYANTNLVLVGRTSKGRKGTAWGHVVAALGAIDQGWAEQRIQDGLGSGEGLIYAVRDPIYKTGKDGRQVLDDAGVVDKRLVIAATEFASPLRVAMRDGNTLSAVIRNAWDTGLLRIVVKNAPATATGAHASIVGHITKQELLAHLNDIEAANGFGNRFLWIVVERSKVLPDGGAVPEDALLRLRARLGGIIQQSRGFPEVVRDGDARRLWRDVYPALSEGKPGLLGAMLGRAEAQVTRLALIFALLDASQVITEKHLRAALAAWRYVEDSAAFIFGATLGNPVADEILARLKEKPNGLTKTEIHALFQGHRPNNEINSALTLLYDAGLAYRIVVQTGGRPAERWFRGRAPAKEAKEEEKVAVDHPLAQCPRTETAGRERTWHGHREVVEGRRQVRRALDGR